MEYPNGLLFDDAFQAQLKDRFFYVDADPDYGSRLFFDNSGGSLRLKTAVDAKDLAERLPDCSSRSHARAVELSNLENHATADILSCVFGTRQGALLTELTASQAMFHIRAYRVLNSQQVH